jgi:hypothetical protein
MLLYHYTGHVFLPFIQEEGLTRGTVLISLTNRVNAVWLTHDPTAADHGLAPDPEICEQRSRETGREVRMVNKLAVRISVKIPPNDQRRLVYWPKWATNRLDPAFYDVLAKTGGNMEKTWWLYWGVIPPAWLIAIDVLQPLTEEDLKLQKALEDRTARWVDAPDI